MISKICFQYNFCSKFYKSLYHLFLLILFWTHQIICFLVQGLYCVLVAHNTFKKNASLKSMKSCYRLEYKNNRSSSNFYLFYCFFYFFVYLWFFTYCIEYQSSVFNFHLRRLFLPILCFAQSPQYLVQAI